MRTNVRSDEIRGLVVRSCVLFLTMIPVFTVLLPQKTFVMLTSLREWFCARANALNAFCITTYTLGHVLHASVVAAAESLDTVSPTPCKLIYGRCYLTSYPIVWVCPYDSAAYQTYYRYVIATGHTVVLPSRAHSVAFTQSRITKQKVCQQTKIKLFTWRRSLFIHPLVVYYPLIPLYITKSFCS